MQNKNPVIYLLIAFASVLLTAGCISTEGTLKLEGKVLDEKTKTGIPNREVFVQGLINENDKSIPFEVGQFSTDSTGSFSYTLKKLKGAWNYNFSIVGDTVYPYTTKSISLGILKINSKYTTLYMSRLADFTIIIKRKNNKPANDTLSLTWESNRIYGWVLYPYKITNYGRADNAAELTYNKELRWTGGNVNTRIRTKVFADKRTILRWVLYRNGKRREFTDTITCKRDISNIHQFTY